MCASTIWTYQIIHRGRFLVRSLSKDDDGLDSEPNGDHGSARSLQWRYLNVVVTFGVIFTGIFAVLKTYIASGIGLLVSGVALLWSMLRYIYISAIKEEKKGRATFRFETIVAWDLFGIHRQKYLPLH